jgi:hypothetical protein
MYTVERGTTPLIVNADAGSRTLPLMRSNTGRGGVRGSRAGRAGRVGLGSLASSCTEVS